MPLTGSQILDGGLWPLLEQSTVRNSGPIGRILDKLEFRKRERHKGQSIHGTTHQSLAGIPEALSSVTLRPAARAQYFCLLSLPPSSGFSSCRGTCPDYCTMCLSLDAPLRTLSVTNHTLPSLPPRLPSDTMHATPPVQPGTSAICYAFRWL